jgi:hypothetical protein
MLPGALTPDLGLALGARPVRLARARLHVHSQQNAKVSLGATLEQEGGLAPRSALEASRRWPLLDLGRWPAAQVPPHRVARQPSSRAMRFTSQRPSVAARRAHLRYRPRFDDRTSGPGVPQP